MNILLLVSDQHRWDALGCAADGSRTAQASWLARDPVVRTPHLDRLAADGARFSNAVCNYPTCLPSRHSLITGLLASQLGLLTNNDYWPDELPVPTLGHLLAEAGFETASFGKMHWKPVGTDRSCVADGRGFQTVLSYHDRVIDAPPSDSYLDSISSDLAATLTREAAGLGEGEDRRGYLGLVSAIPARDSFEYWLTDRLVDRLERREPGRPFFYIWSVDRPHPPGIVPPEYAGHYHPATLPLPPGRAHGEIDPGLRLLEGLRGYSRLTDDERRLALARYLGNVDLVDDCVGRLLDTLDRTGLAADTLVIYTSDHGELMGEHGGYTKYSLYDSAIRVPLLIRWPGTPRAGQVSGAAVELVDVFATILDAAGRALPAYSQGRSLRSHCLDTALAGRAERTASVTEFGTTPEWAIRGERYKLIHRSGGPSALYDLHADPGEWDNRIDDPALAATRDGLRSLLLDRLADAAGRYPATGTGKRRHRPPGVFDYCARSMPG